MSIRYGQFCPIAKAAEILGERWTILIIRELLFGSTRFTDLQRALAQLSPTLLTKRLHQLQDCGLVVRKNLPQQRRAEYHLTPAGRELRPIVLGLSKWGMRWARGQMADDELDVQLLMHHVCLRLDATQLPGGRTVVEFIFAGLPTFSRWWIVVEGPRDRELCVHNPNQPVDVRLRTDLRTLAEIWAGDTEIRIAKKDGRLRVEGDLALIRTLPSWLRISPHAHVRPHPQALRLALPAVRNSRRRPAKPKNSNQTT